MGKQLSKLILWALIFSSLLGASANTEQCRALLDWIYRELTLNTLEQSYNRAMNKMLLGLYTVHNKTKDETKYRPQMARIFNTLKKIDPELQQKLKNNNATKFHFLGLSIDFGLKLHPSELQKAFNEWANLQKTSAELFKGLDKEYLLDDWDIFTVDLISKASTLNFTNHDIKSKIEKLGKRLKAQQAHVLTGKNFDGKSLKKLFDKTSASLLKALQDEAGDILNEYQNICKQEEMELFLKQEQAYCPLPNTDQNFLELNQKLAEIQRIISSKDLLKRTAPIIELTSKPNIPVYLLNYLVNDNIKATYCKRNPNLISMITIHHTYTTKETTPLEVNEYHIDNPDYADDPWYMIGYNYIISETFAGATSTSPKVFQGRPPEMQGAHTGGNKVPLTQEQTQYMQNEMIECGNKYIGFKAKNILEMAAKDGGVKGNLISYGISIIGNFDYREHTIGNTIITGGLPPGVPSEPNENTIEAAAKLACDLQKKNPRIKTIVPHSYWKKTYCPGKLTDHLHKMASIAKELGCQFEVKISKEGEAK